MVTGGKSPGNREDGGKTHGENLGDALLQTATAWKTIRQHDLNAVVTDNAANMIVAIKESTLAQHVTCFAHTLNLAAKRGLAVAGADRLLGRVRRIVGYFHSSTSANEVLKQRMKILELTGPLKLIMDVSTRWNSSYDMLVRYLLLEPAVQSALGSKDVKKHLKDVVTLSDEDQIKLLDTFTRLTIATYAAQFDGYSGQVFKTIGAKPGPQNTTLVETQIVNADSSSVALTYVFRKIKGQWGILDVLLDTGISELARKRSEYRKALMSGGAEALLLMMNSKTDFLLIN